jgi:hypothetical protein
MGIFYNKLTRSGLIIMKQAVFKLSDIELITAEIRPG